jgi:hypothetical protein
VCAKAGWTTHRRRRADVSARSVDPQHGKCSSWCRWQRSPRIRDSSVRACGTCRTSWCDLVVTFRPADPSRLSAICRRFIRSFSHRSVGNTFSSARPTCCFTPLIHHSVSTLRALCSLSITPATQTASVRLSGRLSGSLFAPFVCPVCRASSAIHTSTSRLRFLSAVPSSTSTTTTAAAAEPAHRAACAIAIGHAAWRQTCE